MNKKARKRVIAFVMCLLMIVTLVDNVGYDLVAGSDSNENVTIASDTASETDAEGNVGTTDNTYGADEEDTEYIEGSEEQLSEDTTETQEENTTEVSGDDTDELTGKITEPDDLYPAEEDLNFVTAGEQDIQSYYNCVTITVDGQPFDPSKSYPADTVFTFKLQFSEEADYNYSNQFDYEQYVYTLPEGLNVISVQDTIECTSQSNPYYGKVVGNYTVDNSTTPAKVYVTLDKNYTGSAMNCDCWLTFTATLNLSEDKTEVEITFPDGGDGDTYRFSVDSEPRLETSKTAAYDSGSHTATYTVTVKAVNGSISNVNLTDVLGEDLAYSSGNISYTVNNSDGSSSSGSMPISDGDDSFQLNLGNLSKDSTVTITYKATVDETAYKNNTADDTTNKVNVIGDYTFGGENKQTQASDSYNLGDYNRFSYNWVEKSNGTLNEANQTVSWTVVLNSSKEYPLDGYTFTDILGDDRLSFDNNTSVSVSREDVSGNKSNITLTAADGLTITDNSISYTFNDDEIYKYTITYSTPYTVKPQDVNNITVNNTAQLKGDDLNTSDSGTVSLPGISTNITKTYNSYSDNINGDRGYVIWQYTIDVPSEGLNQVYVEDIFPTWPNAAYLDEEYGFNVSVDGNASVPATSYINNGAGFTMYFNSSDNTAATSGLPGTGSPYKVIVEYKMYLGDGMGSTESGATNPWITNKANLHVYDTTIPSESTVQIMPPAQIEKEVLSVNGTELTYRLRLDFGQVGLGTEDVIVKDLFDTDLYEYKNGSAYVNKSDNAYFDYGYLVNGAVSSSLINDTDSSGNAVKGVEFNLGKLTDTYTDSSTGGTRYYTYFFYYTLNIKDSTLVANNGTIYVDNVAELYINNSDKYISKVEKEYPYNNNILTKTLTAEPNKDNNNNIMFAAEINPNKLDLIEGTDDIVFVDDMCASLNLSVDTIAVYVEKETNNWGYITYAYEALDPSEYSVNYTNTVNEDGTKTFKITIPNGDKQKLKIVYGATLNGLIGSTVTVDNTAYIEGTNISDSIPSRDIEVTSENSGNSDESSGSTGSIPTIKLTKFDSVITSKLLSGAEFDLYSVKVEGTKDASGNYTSVNYTDYTYIGTYLTEEGITTIQSQELLDYGVYCLTETKAPVGYKFDDADEKYLFIFQGNSLSTLDDDRRALLEATGLDVISDGNTVYRANNRKGLVVTANKKLVGKELLGGEFTFKLEECDAGGNVYASGQTNAYGFTPQSVSGTNNEDGLVVFDELTYVDYDFITDPDIEYTFHYKMSEVADANNTDIKYDSSIQIITVTLKYNSNTESVETVVNGVAYDTYDSGKTFTNYYNGAMIAYIDIEGNKELTGKTISDTDIFTFKIEEVKSATDFTVKDGGYTATVENDNNGNFVFKDIPYSYAEYLESGKSIDYHYYIISEVDDNQSGYRYDEKKYVVMVYISEAAGILNAHIAGRYEILPGKTEPESFPVPSVTFINDYVGSIDISVDKDWIDGGVSDTNRASSVSVVLYDTNNVLGNIILPIDAVELSAANSWHYTWKDLPEQYQGTKIDYAIQEINVPNYSTTISGDAEDGFTVTNTLITGVSGKKVWADSNLDHTSDTVTVELLADGQPATDVNGVPVTAQTIGADDNWQYSFENLPVYKPDGNKISYTVSETPVAGYITTYKENSTNGYDITNTKSETVINLKAEKEYLYGTLHEGDFSFKLEQVTDETGLSSATPAYSDIKTNGVATEDTTTDQTKYTAAVNFDNITLKNAGTYYYKITEENAGDSDVVYDGTAYIAIVEVKELSDNSLTSTIIYKNIATGSTISIPTFSNRDDQTTSVVLSGSKKVVDSVGNEVTVNKQFTFDLRESALDGTLREYKNNNAGVFTFSAIDFTSSDAGNHYIYYVSERNDNSSGFTYDTTVYRIDIDIYNDGGNLTYSSKITKYDDSDVAAADENNTDGNNLSGLDVTSTGIVFTNTYDADGSVEIPVVKSIKGYTIPGEYTFVLKDTSGVETDKTITVNTTADGTDSKGTNSFNLEYDLADAGKQFVYTIEEQSGNIEGITYDTTTYTIVIDVTDNGSGKLVLDTKVYKNGDSTQDVGTEGIIFNNTYTAPGAISFNAEKTLTVVDKNGNPIDGATKSLSDDQFSFTLIGTDGTSETVKNDASGYINFSNIQYTLDDIGKTYTYTVSEESGNAGGYNYDATIYEVEVYVGYSTTTSGSYEIKPVATYYKNVNGKKTKLNSASEVKFANTYTVAEESIILTANKTYLNDEGNTLTLAGGEFEFTLTRQDTTQPVQTASNKADGSVSFDEITYTYADIVAQEKNNSPYIYVIKEVTDNSVNMKYSNAVYTVVVALSDNGDGTINKNVSYYNGTVTLNSGTIVTDTNTAEVNSMDVFEFINTKLEDKTLILGGSKTLTGTGLTAKQFTFKLVDANGNVIDTATNDADGNFVFKELTFTPNALESGDPITFIISEVSDNKAGYTYDTNYYKVTVTPKRVGTGDAWDLETVIAKYDVDDNLIKNNVLLNQIEFENSYEADGTLVIDATKTLAGRDEEPLKNGEFTFELYEKQTDGNFKLLDTATNDTAGKISFKAISFNINNNGKSYVYKVVEKKGTDSKISYDTSEYYVVARVSDNGNGKLIIDKSYYTSDTLADDSRVAAISFVNTATTDNSFILQANKKLNGQTLKNDQFSFTLTGRGPRDEMGNETSISYTATNDASGNIVFPAITYTARDVGHSYAYTVSEVDSGVDGFTYQDEGYTVTVLVTLVENEVVATPTYYFNGKVVSDVTFENSYEAKGTATIKGIKYLNNVASSEEFEFGLYEDEACTQQVGTSVFNLTDGSFEFSVDYTQDDMDGKNSKSFTYYVKEIVQTIEPGYKYDETVYPVIVTLTDNYKGVLIPSITYPGNKSQVEIYNTYTDKLVKLSVQKLGANQAMIAGAKMAIYETDDYEANPASATAVVTWSTTAGKEYEVSNKLQLGTKYTLVELAAPDGYKLADPIYFMVTNYAEISLKLIGDTYVPAASTTIKMQDDIRIQVSKQDDTGKLLAGAELAITEVGSDNVLESWTSTTSKHNVSYELKANTEYVLKELSVPYGYQKADSITFKFDSNGNVYTKVNGIYKLNSGSLITMTDDKLYVNISKTDLVSGKEISGAKLTITDSSGNTLISWVSSSSVDKKIAVEDLVAEEVYTFTEITAPFGYDVAESIQFYVDTDGNVWVKYPEDTEFAKSTDRSVIMADAPQYINISKVDITNDKELTGAKLKITDSNGKTIESWTSDGTKHQIKKSKFVANKEYTLVETTAPNGYRVAESIVFKFDEDGVVYVKNGDTFEKVNDTVIMKDAPMGQITISKVDLTSGDELPGAKLTITDSRNDKVIATWTSKTSKHVIDESKFTPNVDYVLTEVTAPYGYDVAESITFKIDEDGNVWVKKADGTYTKRSEVVMKDKPQTVSVSKVDLTNGNELEGAKLTIKDADGNVVDTWISGTSKHKIFVSKFEADKEYTLTEVTAPDGYEKAESITFKIDKNGDVWIKGSDGTFTKKTNTTIVMKDAPTKYVSISKVDMTNGAEIIGAELTITDKNGKTIAKWTSDGKKHLVNTRLFVVDEEYILTEVTAPDGYEVAESITFKLDANGNIYVKNADGSFTMLDSDTLVMKDARTTVTGSSNQVTTDTQVTVTEQKGIKTGDNVPLALIVITMVVSAMGIVLLEMERKKSRR